MMGIKMLGQIYVWSHEVEIREWEVYQPGFSEIKESQDHVEREDEFDILASEYVSNLRYMNNPIIRQDVEDEFVDMNHLPLDVNSSNPHINHNGEYTLDVALESYLEHNTEFRINLPETIPSVDHFDRIMVPPFEIKPRNNKSYCSDHCSRDHPPVYLVKIIGNQDEPQNGEDLVYSVIQLQEEINGDSSISDNNGNSQETKDTILGKKRNYEKSFGDETEEANIATEDNIEQELLKEFYIM